MKKIILVMLVLGLSQNVVFAEVKQEPKKFSVTYKITYNSITLQEAADKEKRIKEQNKDACSVDVSTDNNSGTVYYTFGNQAIPQ